MERKRFHTYKTLIKARRCQGCFNAVCIQNIVYICIFNANPYTYSIDGSQQYHITHACTLSIAFKKKED